jgi:phosphonate degradation associated HDIG domain protein
MLRPLTLDEILARFSRLGGRTYEGEGVTQLSHALQCATLAEREGAGDALVCACLLHDVGHLLNDRGETPTARGIDDRHEHVAAACLADLFGPEITEPIWLHVEAKRWLCATDAGYAASLSEDSVRSLALQGGPLDDDAARAFEARPFAREAIALRRWDDRAKDPAMETPPIEQFVPLLVRCAAAFSDGLRRP